MIHRRSRARALTALLPLVVAVATTVPASAQQQFRATVEAGRVQVVPVDGDRQVVRGLPASVFRVLVDGVPRRIIDVREVGPRVTAGARTAATVSATDGPDADLAWWLSERNPGRRFVVLFDYDIGSPRHDQLRDSYAEVRSLIDGLAPRDELAILVWDEGRLEVTADLTADREELRRAVDELPDRFLEHRPQPPHGRRCCIYRMLESLVNVWPTLSGPAGVTQLLLFTMGETDHRAESWFLAGSHMRPIIDATDALRDLGVIIHAFQPFALPSTRQHRYLGSDEMRPPPRTGRPRIHMARTISGLLAIETAGSAWFYRDALAEGMAEVDARSRSYYIVSFAVHPEDGATIDVELEIDAPEADSWAAPRTVRVRQWW